MWKEEIKASKFPYTVNSEIDAEKILFKNSPERLVLLKWIYTRIYGLFNDITSKELAYYFLNLGIVECDPFEFVEGRSPINDQKKVWSNLFRFTKMMKYSPEVMNNFIERYSALMLMSSTVAVEHHLSISNKILDSLPLEPDNPNLDSIISTFEEQVTKPVATSSGENKIILCKLKEYLCRLSLINAQLRLPESAKGKDLNEFGNWIADLNKNMQTLETVLISSSNVISSMRQLEKKIDDHLLKSEDILELVCNLKKFSGDL